MMEVEIWRDVRVAGRVVRSYLTHLLVIQKLPVDEDEQELISFKYGGNRLVVRN